MKTQRVNYELPHDAIASLAEVRAALGVRTQVQAVQGALNLAAELLRAWRRGDRIYLKRADGNVTELLIPAPRARVA